MTWQIHRQRRTRRRWFSRLTAWALSVGAHSLILLAFLAQPAPRIEPPAGDGTISLALIAAPKPQPVAAKPQPPAKTPDRPLPKRVIRQTPKPPPRVETIANGEKEAEDRASQLSEAQVAGAMTASSAGATGGACNMVRLLQDALRSDPRVQRAMAQAHRGKAILVWNGDWVKNAGQDGAGLAGVREAMMVEIAFAPPACRARPVNGLVLISLAEGAGAPRLALGAGEWRWSDLLFPRRG